MSTAPQCAGSALLDCSLPGAGTNFSERTFQTSDPLLYFYTVAHFLQTFEYNICLVLILLVSQFVIINVLCANICFTRLNIAESRPGHSGPVHHLRAGEGGGLLQPLHDARHQHPLQEAAQAGASALRLHVAPGL